MILRFTKDFDIGDFFAVMIAINVSGIQGAIFGASLLWFSRIFSIEESFEVTKTLEFLIWVLLYPFLWIVESEYSFYDVHIYNKALTTCCVGIFC